MRDLVIILAGLGLLLALVITASAHYPLTVIVITVVAMLFVAIFGKDKVAPPGFDSQHGAGQPHANNYDPKETDDKPTS